MTEVTLVKRLIVVGMIVFVMLGAVACTREKPLDMPTPVIAQSGTLVPSAVTPVPSGATPTPVTLVPGPTETRALTATPVIPPPSLVTPSVTPPPAATPLPSAPTTYTVQWGDWMRKIAERHGVTVDALVAANPSINPNRIYPGQVLNIPAPGGSVVSPPTGGATPFAPPGGPTTYTVQRGEWLYQIARKFGISVAQLQTANPGVNPNYLYPGQVLNIPGGAAPNPPPSGLTTPTPSSGVTPTPGTGSAQNYTVQPGDTLYSIAVRFRTTPYAIQIANHLPNVNAIYPGMVLIIPQQ